MNAQCHQWVFGVSLGRPHPESPCAAKQLKHSVPAPRVRCWQLSSRLINTTRCVFIEQPAQAATMSAMTGDVIPTYLQDEAGSFCRVQHRGVPAGETLTALHKFYLPHHAATRKSGLPVKRELQMLVRAVPCSRAIKMWNSCQLKPPYYSAYTGFTELLMCSLSPGPPTLPLLPPPLDGRRPTDRPTGDWRAPSIGDKEQLQARR